MQATDCPFYTACRQQVTENAERRAKGQPAARAHAEKVGCDDVKPDMDQRCQLLGNLLVRLAAARSEREHEYSENGA